MSELGRNLLEQAHGLQRMGTRGRPRQSSLRRSVSTAYYSVFHLLTDASAKHLIGAGRERRAMRLAVRRGFEHSTMRSVCKTFGGGGTLPAVLQAAAPSGPVSADLRDVAVLFVTLQDERHLADYDLTREYSRGEARQLVDEVQDLYDNLWPGLKSDPHRDVFLVALLLHRQLARR